jgi:putative membrane protein
MSIIHWIVGALSILVTAYLLPGVVITVPGSFVLAIVLGLLNIFIKPLIFILTLPINILTLGLFSLVINALLIILAAKIVPGFAVGGFWNAMLFSIVLSLVGMVLGTMTKPIK